MRREPPSKSLFSYPVAQTNQDLGRDKGKIRLCFGNCGKKEAMSQCLLSQKNILLTGEAVGQSLYMYLEVGWEGQIGTWEFGGNGVGVRGRGRECE